MNRSSHERHTTMKCLLQNEDRHDIPLRWDNRSARELAGKTVRLRFRFRGASIYAVTSRESP